MRKTLRYYQSDAEQSIINAWNSKSGIVPYVSVMTGLGKSLIMASITNKALNKGKRILQLVPRKELVEQNYLEAFNFCDNKTDIGICCGQLNKNQAGRKAVIAMASSFLSKRSTSGSFDVVLIDECHLVKIDGKDEKISTYNKILKSLFRINPNMLVAGLTGTGYRLDQGMLHEKSHKGEPLFTDLVYDTAVDPGIPKLIKEGYLSHIEMANTGVSIDLKGVRTSGKDFNKDDVGVKFDAICEDATEDMRRIFEEEKINTALIFVSNLKNAQHVLDVWGDNSTMRIVSGDTKKKRERNEAIKWLKEGKGKRYIVNCDILTTGFDYKALQSVVLMRATKSPGLLVQMGGRIIRPHDSKEHGWLLDYGTNCERLGRLDAINPPKPKKRPGEKPQKLCTAILSKTIIDQDGITHKYGDLCNTVNILSAKTCKMCKAKFMSVDESGNYKMQTKEQALQAKIDEQTIEYEVGSVSFEEYIGKKDIPMIRMSMWDEDFNKIHDHFLCLDHHGFARDNSLRFLMRMFKNHRDYYKLGTVGISVRNILPLLNNHYDAVFKKIIAVKIRPQKKNTRFNEIKSITFEE